MKAGKSTIGKKLAVTGALLQFSPLIGAAGTTVGMMSIFKTLGGSDNVSDPQELSANIGQVLIVTATGFGLSLVGLVLLCIALFALRYRAPWFFWFLVIYGGLLVLGFPVGTIFGGVFLVFCLSHKNEFLIPTASGAP